MQACSWEDCKDISKHYYAKILGVPEHNPPDPTPLTPPSWNSFNIYARKKHFYLNNVKFDFSMGCIHVKFQTIRIENENINSPFPVLKMITNICITDSKTKQIFMKSNHYYYVYVV